MMLNPPAVHAVNMSGQRSDRVWRIRQNGMPRGGFFQPGDIHKPDAHLGRWATRSKDDRTGSRIGQSVARQVHAFVAAEAATLTLNQSAKLNKKGTSHRRRPIHEARRQHLGTLTHMSLVFIRQGPEARYEDLRSGGSNAFQAMSNDHQQGSPQPAPQKALHAFAWPPRKCCRRSNPP